jgi:hypothetical protein
MTWTKNSTSQVNWDHSDLQSFFVLGFFTYPWFTGMKIPFDNWSRMVNLTSTWG